MRLTCFKCSNSYVISNKKNILDKYHQEEKLFPNEKNCVYKIYNIKTGKPGFVDESEPKKIAEAVSQLGLEHVVVTSVDRDDLEDGGAKHFTRVIRSIREINESCTIEILTPDFNKKNKALDILSNDLPDWQHWGGVDRLDAGALVEREGAEESGFSWATAADGQRKAL